MAQTNVQVFSGSVGIGTTSAGAPLSILSTSGNHLRLHYNDAYYNTLERDTSGNFNIRASDGVGGINTQMTIHSNGSVGIGTTNPSQGNLSVQGLGADPYFFGQSSGTYADATDFTGLGHFKSSGSHGVIRVSNTSDNTGSTRIDFNTRLGNYWETNSVVSSFFRGTAPAAGRIMVTGEIDNNYEDANMTFWTCRDGYDTGTRFDGLGGTGSLKERMRITSIGNVGIGTTNPACPLHISGNGQTSTGGIIRAQLDDPGGAPFEANAFTMRMSSYSHSIRMELNTLRLNAYGNVGRYGNMQFVVGDGTGSGNGQVTAMTIGGGGNVGIGTASPGAKLEVVQGGSIKLSGSYDHSTAKLYIDRDGPASWGSTTLYDAFRYFETRNSSGVEHFNSVKIGASGIAIGYDPPGYTRQAVEGIICSKRVAIGRTTASYTLDVNGDIRMNNNLRGQGQSRLYFDNNNEPKLYSVVGTQFLFATNGYAYAVLWNSTSDRRLKKNIKPLSNAIDTIKKLNPVHYDKRYTNNDVCDEECTVEKCYNEEDGFIAQEIQEIPELAHAVSKPESNDMLGLNYNSILTYCVKAVQEQQEIIETEKAKVAELLSRVTALENKETSNVA